ncbi:Tetratricopeptide (TPR) repeat [Streptomyces sp. TLI_053]|uniref:ATP-binding protein n=1 Tax=Streptomyces sp. TLI_053 TaxID=1855352 RepID=UPI00087DCD53|nr:ATP-binding protein [Streptomyces sp. TLI_053]SDT83462.1 Tetratricopeptide (TPR) repeat [Streptomyces sp. TLI_053]
MKWGRKKTPGQETGTGSRQGHDGAEKQTGTGQRNADAGEQVVDGGPGLRGSTGAIVAAGDVIGSSTQFVQAEQALVLPAEAYAPIPADAALGGVSNVRGGLFVGRREELALLDAAFEGAGEVVVHAVHGLGGVGKSALATHWASMRTEPVRWRITADTAVGVRAGLASLARALQPGLTGLPEDLQVERAVRWLAGHDGWLLVLDNVDDPANIEPLLERIPRGRVLVTTRRTGGWHHRATAVRLGVLEAGDALDLFVRVLTHDGPRESEGAEAVCEELGHLALAVEQAAAYCAQTGTVPVAYLEMLARWPADMFAAGAETTDSERTIARIWHLTLDRLTDTPLAGDILRILAWYAPDNIPRELLHHLAAEPDGPTVPQISTAVGRLLAYSMITDNRDGTLTVHRLVQTLARTPDPHDPHRRANDITTARHRATQYLAAAFPDDTGQPDRWPFLLALIPHVDSLADRTPEAADTVTTAAVLNSAGLFLITGQGQARRAAAHLRRSLTSLTRILGEDAPDTLTTGNNLAGAYRYAGDLARAIPLYEHLLQDRVRVLGEDAPDTLTTRNNLAHAYQGSGDLARAIPLYEQTLDTMVRILGKDAPHTLITRNNLAGAYQDAGRIRDAITLYKQTLQDRVRVLGEDAPDTLNTRDNLAGAYRGAGDLARAIPLYEQTLEMMVRVLGEDAPDTLITRGKLAHAYQASGAVARAIPLYEQTLDTMVRVLGEDAPHTLSTRGKLAHAYQASGAVARAIPLFEQLLQDQVRVLGEDAPNTLTTRNNVAASYRDAGDLARAVPLFEQLLQDQVRVLGEDAPNTLTTRNNLAQTYQTSGNVALAVPLFEQLLQDQVRVLGEDAPDTLTTRNNLAHAYQGSGDLACAIPLFEQTLDTMVRVLGEDAPHTLITRKNLASAYREAGDLARAIPLYEQLLQNRVRTLGEDAPETLISRNNLAAFYRDAGRTSDAVAVLRSVVEGRVRVLGPDHQDTVDSRVGLLVTLVERGRSLLPGNSAGAWQNALEAVQAVGPYFVEDPGVYGTALAHAFRLAADVLDVDGQSEAAAKYRQHARYAAGAAAAARRAESRRR